MNTLIALALSLVLPALGQPPSSPDSTGGSDVRPGAVADGIDPHQTICRRYRESGSRIAIRRTCMTRQEWAAHDRELRKNVDRAQMTRVIGGK